MKCAEATKLHRKFGVDEVGVIMALCYWTVIVLSAVSTLLPPAYAQTGSGGGGGSIITSFSYSELVPGGKGPFSAEFISTTVRTLSDGTHITNVQKRSEARDSQGRTRNATYLPDYVAKERNEPPGQPMFITIMDPVSGKHIHLNPQQKTATVISFPTILPPHPPQRVVASQPVQPGPRPNVSREKLGGQTIDGVYAEGTRTTAVYPAGTQGNDRDITVVSERWISQDLGVEVLVKTSDPRSGETTTEVQNLNRAEPDPALFEVPADYKIQSQAEPHQQ
jgi:hypothetical protein